MEFYVLILIALIVSCIGFKKYVWFISLGYGFSIAAIGAAMLITLRNNLTIGTLLASILFIVYGIRLGGYLLIRELKSASYGAAMKKEIKDGKTMPFIAKVSIWVSCALLYATQTSPIFFRLKNNSGTDTLCIIGVAIMTFGLFIESLADIQKSKAKKVNPNRFCDTGLYKIVRCPNYLGEVIFWTGVFVTSFTTLTGFWQWASAIFGYVLIIYVMFSGCRRLEIRQNKNYGSNEEYKNYVKKTPIMLPLIPLYSVEKHKWLVG